jgi:hypothetical protein
MLKINHSLKDEIRELQAKISMHVGSDCGGILEASSIIGHSAVNPSPLKALHMGGQSYSSKDTCSAFGVERLEEGFGEGVGDSPNSDAMHHAFIAFADVECVRCTRYDRSGTTSSLEVLRRLYGQCWVDMDIMVVELNWLCKILSMSIAFVIFCTCPCSSVAAGYGGVVGKIIEGSHLGFIKGVTDGEARKQAHNGALVPQKVTDRSRTVHGLRSPIVGLRDHGA